MTLFDALFSWLLQNGIVLVVILPMLMAFFIVVLGIVKIKNQEGLPWLVVGTMGLNFLISMVLICHVIHSGEKLVHNFGGWALPLGIGYQLDLLSVLFFFLVALLSFCASLYMVHTLETIPESKRTLFLALFLLCVSGFFGIVLTADIFNAFVFLEISSLTSCALVAFGGDKRAFYSAYNYLLLGSIGAGFFVIGVAFLYMVTGTLSMPDIHRDLIVIPRSDNGILKISFCFIVLGLLIKSFAFFMHRLLSQIYTCAPAGIVSFFSGVTSKITFYLLLRFLFSVFAFQAPFEMTLITHGLIVMGILGVLIPALCACFENDIRRLLAYSSLSQVSYLFLSLALLSKIAIMACLLQVLAHAFSKSGLFMISGFIEKNKGHCLLHKLHGYLKSFPVLAIFLCTFSASLAGMPFTVGFLAKWYLLQGAWENYLVFFVLIFSSLMAFIYSARLVMHLVIATSDKELRKQTALVHAPFSVYMPLGILLGLNVLCVIGGGWVCHLTQQLAGNFLGS